MALTNDSIFVEQKDHRKSGSITIQLVSSAMCSFDINTEVDFSEAA